MKGATCVLTLLLASTLMSHDLVEAQSPVSPSNPLGYFSFNPQEVMGFLWNSLKPQYVEMWRDKQVLGNASIYIVQLAKQVLPANVSEQLITSRLGKDLLDAVDSEMARLYRNMDTQTATVEEMLQRLREFDRSKIVDVMLTQSLSNIPGVLSQNMTNRMNEIITKLEMDDSIADDLFQLVDSLPMMMLNSTELAEQLDVALRDLTKVLMTEPRWSGSSDLYKMRTLLMSFDYQGFGMDLVMSALRKTESSLPVREKKLLEDFIQKLNNSQPLNFTHEFKKGFPIVYSYLRNNLNVVNLPSLPANMDYRAVEFLGVFDIVETKLGEAMKRVAMTNSSSYSLWMDSQVTDLERLFLILRSVNYMSIGQEIMGNVLNVMDNNKEMTSFTYSLITELFDGMNLTTGNEALINTTADIFIQAIQESLMEQKKHVNWTSSSYSERLGMVINGADWSMVARKLFIAVMKTEESALPASIKQEHKEMVQLIKSANKTEINSRLLQQLDKIYQMAQNSASLTAEDKTTLEPLVNVIAQELIDTYQLVENGVHPVAVSILNEFNLTFVSLTDTEKLVYLVVSVNYSSIGQEVMDVVLESEAGRVLEMLRRKESIIPAFRDFVSTLQRIPVINSTIGDNITELMESQMMTDVLENIDSQLLALYEELSANTTVWESHSTNRSKLMFLLEHYNYQSTGDIMMLHILEMLDSMLPDVVSPFIDDFIDKVDSRQSMFDFVKALRNKMVEIYPNMQWLTLDSLMPVVRFIDQHVNKTTEEEHQKWKAISGKLPKVYAFLRTINNTRLMEETREAGFQLVTNFFSRQLVPDISDEIREMVVNGMNVIEAGGVTDALHGMLEQMASSNPIMSWLTNTTIARSIIDSMSGSIMNTYWEVKKTSDSEWRIMSSEEKFMRVVLRMDMPQMMMDAIDAAMAAAKPFINPTYSAQCSEDLSAVTYALGKIMSDPMGSMWAMKLVDAWGKLPAGLLQARFTWPGEMNECEKVRGDRVRIINETTGEVEVVEKEGIKGAWTMAALNIPLPQSTGLVNPFQMPGSSGVDLQWGICLPATCEYDDIMTFMNRVEAFGAKVKYAKPRAAYPSVNGAYKTDPKFIGVSVFFGILALLLIVCTFIDRMILMKMEEKKKKKEKMYELNKMNGTAHVNGGFVHDEKAQTANGHIEGGAQANGGFIVDEKPVKKESRKPGVGIQLLKAFSLYANLPKLMDSSSKPNQLRALDCIRFLSMTWVILGHVYAFIVPYTQNMAAAMEFGGKGDWTFMGVSGGVFAVDSFFLLSGLLVGYLFLKVVDKVKGKVTCLTMTLYYVHRYLRLLPLYGAIILMTIAYSNYLGTGPLNSWFTDAGPVKNFCNTNWWINLLYINNLYNTKEMCVGVTWYLANDMQFYVISPLLLLPLYWSPKIGLVLISALWCSTTVATGWLWGIRDGGSMFTGDPEVMGDIYIKPWCRIGPYLIGLILAFMLFKKVKVKSCIIQAIWWIMSFGIFALVIYIPYDSTKEGGIVTSSWNSTQRALYETLCKNVWALALGWVIFASNTGCGGFIGDVLSWGGWAPLSRLTYAAYLVHPLILELNYKNRHNLIYVDNNSLIHDDIAFVTITYMAALILHLLVEAPMLAIEKLLVPR